MIIDSILSECTIEYILKCFHAVPRNSELGFVLVLEERVTRLLMEIIECM